MSLIAIVAQLLIVGIMSVVLEPEIFNKWYNTIALLPMDLTILLVAILFMKKVEKAPKIVQKKEFGVKQFIPYIFIAFGVMYVGNIIGTILNNIFAMLSQKEAVVPTEAILDGAGVLQNLLLVGIIAPIVEEIIFRKLLVDRLSRYGEVCAIIVSGIAFGLFHGNIVQGIYATLFGFVLAFVYCKSGKIIYPIIIHMIVNISNGVLGTWIFEVTDFYNITAMISESADNSEKMMEIIMENATSLFISYGYVMILAGFSFAGIVLFIVFLVKNIKSKNFLLGAERLVKGKRFSTVVLNVGVILFIVFWVGMIAINILTTYFV